MATTVSEYPKGAAPNGTPSATGSAYPKVAKLPEDIQPEVRALVGRLQDYKAATEWGAIDDATSILDDDAVYDSPFMYITGGRDRVRAVAKLIAPFAYTQFDPKLIRIGMNSAARKAEVEVDGTLRVVPRRYWFLPVTWFLPSSIPIEGTVSLDVKSWNDKVARVTERFANLPTVVPVAFRWLAGWAVGTFGAVAEPVLAQLYDWYSTGYDNVQGQVSRVADSGPVAAVSQHVEGAKQALASGVDTVKNKVAGGVSE